MHVLFVRFKLDYWFPTDYSKPDVTAIVVASCDRLFSLQHLLYRWRG